jgi:hypothetical protein
MSDVFKEQLVKKEKNNKDNLMRVGIVAGAIIVFLGFSAFTANPVVSALFPFVFLVLCGAAYVLFTMLNVEYEYIYTNGELDIDRITNKSRRKRVFSSDVRAIEIMAHAEDRDHASEFKNVEKTLDFSSGKIKPNTYYARVPYEGKMIKLVIEPNQEIQDFMIHVLTPRKFLIKKY